jgi:hypothetical protein
MNFSTLHRQIAFLGGIAFLVFGILSLELFCVLRINSGSDALLNQNLIQRQANERMRVEIQGLRATQQKISAMFVRLNDAVFNLKTAEAERTSGRSRIRSLMGDERPSAIQAIADGGVVVQPGRPTPGEASAIFEAGSSRLEFQRLIPLLAEQENSNAFLYIDRIIVSRPAATPPFSELPTYLDTRFSIRILASK